jgi:RNA polymerase sigma factor (sigma-70 family)
MSTNQLKSVIQRLRRAALLREGGELTDGQLLECFIRSRDHAAFEALVQRYGPMVFGVCSRQLHNVHDVEDAYQATFLVLLRKANSIKRPELLGNWLYGVAYRTALAARVVILRRRARERQVETLPEPEIVDASEDWRDLRPVLDLELNRLPDKYRVTIILCDVQGRTRREVARQLDIPVGTLSGRLTTARRLLAKRLARRGLTLSGGALLGAISQGMASACPPPPLVAATFEVVAAITAGQVQTAVVTARVNALARGALKAMFVKKLTITSGVILLTGIILGSTIFAHRPQTDQAPKAPRVLELGTGQRGRRVVWSPNGTVLAVVTKTEKTFLGVQYDRRGSSVRLWDVEKGKVSRTLAESSDKGLAFQRVAFSPDGSTIAGTVSEVVTLPNAVQIQETVKLWDVRTGSLKQTLGGSSQCVCVGWSPDGELLAAGDPSAKAVTIWNTKTGTLERTLKTIGTQPWSLDFSPNGKHLAVGGQNGDHSGEVLLWSMPAWALKQGWKQTQYVNEVAFSPDGREVVCCNGSGSIQVWSVESGRQKVSLKGNPRASRTIAVSPNGKIVAAGGHDGNIRLWDAHTGTLSSTLQGHEDEIYSIAFSPDGKTLASVSQDQTLRLWQITGQDTGQD